MPEEWDLSGKRALITADRRGWTPHLASALAEAGADVAVAGWRTEHVEQAAAAVEAQGRRTIQIVGDIARGEQAQGAVEQVTEAWGGLDILVNNAQAQFGKPFEDVTEDEWDRLMDYNVRSMFLLCQAAPGSGVGRGGGGCDSGSSGLAGHGLGNAVPYSAYQGAALQLARGLALEWSQKEIRINDMTAWWLSTDEISQEEADKDPLARFIPLRRLGHPREVGPLLVYLASDACDFVTGQAIAIDGGAIAHG